MRRFVDMLLVGLAGLLLCRPASADDVTLAYSGPSVATSWGLSYTSIQNQLCVHLKKLPDIATGSQNVSLDLASKEENGKWSPIGRPVTQDLWKPNGLYCWSAPQAGVYAVVVLANGWLNPLSKSTIEVDSPTLTSATMKSAPKLGAAEEAAAVLAAARLVVAGDLPGSAVRRSAWTGRGEVTLYFLPDGSPAKPMPKDLSERDTIHLKVLLPKDDLGAASFDVTACPTRDLSRIEGSQSGATSGVQSVEAIQIVLQDLPDLRCGSGQTSFTIKTPYGSQASSLTLGDVYSGTFAVQFTFDFTPSGRLGTGNDGTGRSVIIRSDDPLGPKVVPSFVWHPAGYDPNHLSVLGALVNPSLGLDLDAMTSSFYFGDQICGPGVCLAVGGHVRKVDGLTAASGLGVGSPFDPSKGALPTESKWSATGGGLGVFVGATIDVNVAAKLLSK
jgi:hypothetical protein